MTQPGQHTLNEIHSQPTTWADALALFRQVTPDLRRLWEAQRFDQAIFTGCGSSYYLAHTGARLFQALTGITARAAPAAELVFSPETYLPAGAHTLLVAPSRSGETSETIQAVEVFRERGQGGVLALGCSEESTLSKRADLPLVIASAREESVVQTRSLSSLTVLMGLLAATLSGQGGVDDLEPLPAAGEHLLADYGQLARELGESEEFERFYVLGSHALFGIASEGSLKLKEMSLSHSEPFHTLEFRHGPMAMVNQQTLVIGLVSERSYRQETAVLREMQLQGAQVLTLADQAGDDLAAWSQVVLLRSRLPFWGRPPLYLPVMQLMACHRAIKRGLNPDRPTNLQPFITLDDLRSE
jgi:glutamine---fructose-6-phosphate transaminase (isomerizing)